MDMSFAAKRVFVTGATGLLGSELSRAFAEEAAFVMLSDVEVSAAEAQRRLAVGASHSVYPLNLANLVKVRAFVDELTDAERPDVVVNNAGIYPFGDLLDSAPKEFEPIFKINTMAPRVIMQRFAKRWIAKDRPGVFVNASSASAEVAQANGSAYRASKAALEPPTRRMLSILAFTRSASTRCGPASPRERRLVDDFLQNIWRASLRRCHWAGPLYPAI
jgi:3-oxoacyl-[acyl-carrier protein] reductase